MVEYKLELTIQRLMGFEGEIKFNGTTNDPQLALAATLTLDIFLKNSFGEGGHNLTIYRDNTEITKQELTEDHKKYCQLNRLG